MFHPNSKWECAALTLTRFAEERRGLTWKSEVMLVAVTDIDAVSTVNYHDWGSVNGFWPQLTLVFQITE